MKPLVKIARETADRIPQGSRVAFKTISSTLNSIPEPLRLSFGLCYLAYLDEKELKMTEEDEMSYVILRYNLINKFCHGN